MSDRNDSSRDAELEEILVDTYGDDEQAAAWEVAFQDGVAVPFEATLLGIPITVTEFRLSRSNALQCRVRREKQTERWVGVDDLDDKGLPDDFAHVLGLYHYWSGEN